MLPSEAASDIQVWEFSYIPISTVQAADRFGDIYETSAIVTADLQLNETAYAEYSPVYLSASFSMTFMLAFALSTALIMHTLLFHGPRIWKTVRNMRTEIEDIHMKLMRKYPEVPDWWFLLLLGATFITAVAIIEKYKTELPVWGYIISILLPLIYLIPAAFIYAMTNQTVAINLLAELIPGYLFQGKTIAGMVSSIYVLIMTHMLTGRSPSLSPLIHCTRRCTLSRIRNSATT